MCLAFERVDFFPSTLYADNIDYRKVILKTHHGTIENFEEATENNLFLSKIEESIISVRLIQFRESGDEWKGDAEATELFYFWKKAKEALDDSIEIECMDVIDENHDNQMCELISEAEIAAWSDNDENALIEPISDADLLQIGYSESMIDNLFEYDDGSTSAQTPVELPKQIDAKANVSGIKIISDVNVTNGTIFDVVKKGDGMFIVPAVNSNSLDTAEICNEDSIPIVANNVEIRAEKEDNITLNSLQSKAHEVQVQPTIIADSKACISGVSAKVDIRGKHEQMSMMLSRGSAKVQFNDKCKLQSMSVLSSEAYIHMMREKSEKKQKAEETRNENKLKRLKNKEEKEEKQRMKALKEKVPKAKQAKCSNKKLLKPKSNEDPDGDSGANSNSATIGHVQLYEKNQFVLIRTGNIYVPGKIKQIDENRKYHVRLMMKSGPIYWKWPANPNYIWIKRQKIKFAIKPPKKVSNRGQFTVDELNELYQQLLFGPQ